MAVGLNLLFFAFLAVILGTSQSNLYDMLVSNAIARRVVFLCGRNSIFDHQANVFC